MTSLKGVNDDTWEFDGTFPTGSEDNKYIIPPMMVTRLSEKPPNITIGSPSHAIGKQRIRYRDRWDVAVNSDNC